MRTPETVPRELLEKYDRPVPRYTSYPTALHFDESVDGRAAVDRLDSRSSSGPVSLYFHVPFCEKLCWYCACNRVIERDTSVAGPYVDALLDEMDLKREWIGDRPVVQIHFGGGTPTFLPPDEIRRLGAAIHSRFDVAGDAEISVEIDPRACDAERIGALAEAGFNRASIGVQDHDPEVQEAIHREQPYETTRRTVERLREAGFGSINFDVIYGLPHQTVDSFAGTLDDLVELGADRVAVYSYAHVPWKNPAQKHLEEAGLPDASTKFDLLSETVERLTDAGMVYIGLDHFAAPDDGLARAFRDGTLRRNFQGYSTHRETEIFAFGVSGISQAAGAYVQNEKDLEDYYDALDDPERPLPVARGCLLDRDDETRRETIMHVMCRSTLDFDELSSRLGIDFADYFADELERLAPLEEDGLVEVHSDAVEIRPLGRLFLRNIASAFDAYLDPEESRYSTAV
ncbi:MAG: oxygen-independent coproporphyrinogen III oxidase [Bradymonadaceae bacterium]